MLLFVTSPLLSANYLFYSVGKSTALGGSGVCLSNVWSVFSNPGALGFVLRTELATNYKNRFNLKETGESAFSFVLPTGSGTFGISVSHYGYAKYRETGTGIAFGKQISENYGLGIKISFLSSASIQPYENLTGLVCELGFLGKINEKLSLGFHAFNPVYSTYFGNTSEKINPVFSLGLSYLLMPGFQLHCQLSKEINTESSFRLGLSYQINKVLSAQSGYNIKEKEFSFGATLNMNPLHLGIAFVRHPILGYSPGISVSYTF